MIMLKNLLTLARKQPQHELKLEPKNSRIKPGGYLEVECTSFAGHTVNWEGKDGAPLPYNFEVCLA